MPLAQWLHELHERLPVDICREIRAMVWEPLTDETLPSAVASWSDPRTVRQTLQRFGLIELWDVRHVTNMDRLFLDRKHFSADLSRWDTRHVRSMVQTFHGASSFNGPLGRWNVGQVIDMRGMFDGCQSFNQPLAHWDVSQVR